MRRPKRKYIIKAKNFGNKFRFIDYLTTINDEGELKQAIQEIYSPEIKLKRETTTTNEESFF